jgi:hypothetical protein
MGGLIFIAVIGVWFFIVWALTSCVAKKSPDKWWRIPLSLLLFVVFLILPVVDEVVGGWQFKRLCEANTNVQVDKVTAVGKTVYLAKVPVVEVKGTWVRIVQQPWRYLDVESGEIVVSYNTLRASGSFLGKHLAQDAPPLIFKGSCAFAQKGKNKIFRELGITQVQRSSIKQKD